MRVLVTRAAADAQPLCEALRRAGHEPVLVPLLRRRATGRAAPSVADVDWVVWTSAAAVRLAVGIPEGPRHAAVGMATATALGDAGVFVDVVGKGTGSELVRSLELRGRVVLYPRARQVTSGTLAALEASGARVQSWVVYANVEPVGVGPSLARADVERVVLMSPSAARRYAALAAAPVVAICIGPTTAAAARAAGLEVVDVARVPGIPGVVEAVGRSLGR